MVVLEVGLAAWARAGGQHGGGRGGNPQESVDALKQAGINSVFLCLPEYRS